MYAKQAGCTSRRSKKIDFSSGTKIIPFDNDIFSLFNISCNGFYFVFFLELQKQISNIKTLISILLFRFTYFIMLKHHYKLGTLIAYAMLSQP